MQHLSVADNDVLTLNVGGTILCTSRFTLTQVSAPSVCPLLQHVHFAGHPFSALVCTRCKVLLSCIAAVQVVQAAAHVNHPEQLLLELSSSLSISCILPVLTTH